MTSPVKKRKIFFSKFALYNKTDFHPVQEPVEQEVRFYRGKNETSLGPKLCQQTKI